MLAACTGLLDVRVAVPRFGRQFVAAGDSKPAGYFSDDSDGGLSWSESPRRAAGPASTDVARDGARVTLLSWNPAARLPLLQSCKHCCLHKHICIDQALEPLPVPWQHSPAGLCLITFVSTCNRRRPNLTPKP